MISVIVYGRNDSHGYNLPKRAALSFNCIAEVLTHQDDEIIFVDCNTPDDLPTFPESIADTLTPRARRLLRILRLRPAQYEKGKNGTKFKVLEPLCRNVAIRRSNPRNRWILNTNTDMVFVPLATDKSLSDVAAKLPDGFYELPRFEMPEILWETTDRGQPNAIIESFKHWGRRLHVNEMVTSLKEIVFDGPGDFQLALRKQMFAIHGMNEQMVLGWHVDSNLCKRLFLLNGETKSLLDHVYAYHCDHTRLNTIYHSATESTANDLGVFFNDVATPYLPVQAETWGLPQEEIEELRLTEEYAGRYAKVLENLLPGLSVPMLKSAYTGEAFNHGLLYDNHHILPYITDHLTMISPAATIGYFGCNVELLRLIAEFRKAYGHTGHILYDQSLMASGRAEGLCLLPAECVAVKHEQLFERSFVFCFDLSMKSFPEIMNGAGYAIPKPSPAAGGHAALLLRRFLDCARYEKEQVDKNNLLTRRFLILGSHNTWFESATTQLIGVVLTPYSSYVRHGFVRKDAFSKPFEAVFGHQMLIGDSFKDRFEWMAGRVGRPVTLLECLLGEMRLKAAAIGTNNREAIEFVTPVAVAPDLARAVLQLEIAIAETDGQFDQANRLGILRDQLEKNPYNSSSATSGEPLRQCSSLRDAGVSTTEPARRTKPTTIGIDARTFYHANSNARGESQYALHHLLHVARLKPEWQFILFGDAAEPTATVERLLQLPNVRQKLLSDYQCGEIDLWHIPDPLMLKPGFGSPMELMDGVPSSIIFYDLIGLRCYWGGWQEPVRLEYLERLEQLLQPRFNVLAISEYTRKDLITTIGINPKNVRTIMAGLNRSENQRCADAAAIRTVKEKYSITKPFFLHVGALDPHKNFETVINSLAQIRPQGSAQLVVVGEKSHYMKQIADFVAGLKMRDIIFTGFIPRSDLEVLYQEAISLLSLPHYEGFGFRVLEAMALGCPVIATNVTSIPEIAGDAALIFSPKDVTNIRGAMQELLNQPQKRVIWREKGRVRAAQFSWTTTARKTICAWQEMLGLAIEEPPQETESAPTTTARKAKPSISAATIGASDGYIAQAAEQAGERALAEYAASPVLQVVTDFAPAKKLHSPAFKAAPAAATAPLSLADCLQQAEAHFNQDDLAGAAAALRQAVVLEPNATDARITLGSLLYQQGDFAGAYEQFLATAKLQPANAAVQVKLAASAIKLDRFTEFESALGLAFQFEPENLDALRLLAGLNFQSGRHADAARTFHRILQHVPNDEESLLCLGKCFFEMGDLDSTQLVFEQVLNNNPVHALAQENLAVVKRKLAESRTALQPVPKVCSEIDSSNTTRIVTKPDRQEVGPTIVVTRPLPKISIVTPSFNQGQFLEECLDSILSQNYPNLEYIVMDGGSRDRSVEIIKKHAKHMAHWQSQPDSGQYHAIQAGFKRSGGEIMFWLNSDDKLHPGSLDVVAEVFNQRPNVEWIMGRPTAWDEAGLQKELPPELPQWSREKYLARKFNKGFIQQESTFWRRSVWDKAGGCLDTQIKLAADFELWARFFRFARLQVVDAMLGGFRYHSAQKTATRMREYEAEVDEIIGRETRLLECSTDKTLLPAPTPLDITTLNRAASRIAPANFSYFTYSKRPHFGFFRDHDLALYGRRIDPAQCDLKVYQDLLVYTFIKDNIAPGSRILEVGGGDSRVLKALMNDYECWNLDKLEGVGNGLNAVDATGYRLVKDYLGSFSEELPAGYFDFVFSISVFEHLEENQENFRSVWLDMDRIMKTGALSLHCIDVVQQQEVWANKVLPFIFKNVHTANKTIPLGQLKMDPHTFYMSEEAYNHGWKNITKKSYQDFGRPLSYNVLWKKTGGPILDNLKEGQPEPALGEPLVSVIVSTYAAEKYIRACLEDLEAQTIADKLEIIVIDSGSPENEHAIVEEFQQSHNNISYHRTERETIYAAWNRAIGLARGKYIANANCDDAHRPDALEKLVAALEAHPEADLTYGDYYTTSVPNGSFANPSILRHVVHPSYHPATVMMYCVTGCHPMWRKTVFDKLGLFDPTYTAPGDYEFLFRFVQAGLRAIRVPQPLSLFFQNAEGLSWKSAAQTKKEIDRILGKYRSQIPIERLFKVDLSDAASVSKAWVTLGNLAMQHEVPWFTNFIQNSPYARFCYEQALKADSHNVAAAQNLIVTRMLQQHSSGDLGFLEHFPAEVANALLRDIKRGQLRLAPAEMPPAVEPIEFGEPAVTREVLSGAVLPLLETEVLREGEQNLSPRPSLPVRLAGVFLNHGGQASDALNLALPLASRINLATLDQDESYDYSFDVNLPESVRAALFATRSKFNFCLGGIGISHRAADELNRVQGVNYHIGRTMFEADRLPMDWVTACNQMDELWVPSQFNAEVFANSGVERDKLVIIPSAVNPREFDPTQHTPLPLPNRAAFNFLSVFEWCTRKGWDVLIASYLREFSGDDDVCLYLRTSLAQKSEAEARIAIEQKIREFTRSLNLGDKKLPRVEILTGEIPIADMPKLYRAADCVVAPSRGEAWGRVAHEAMMMALPVIATNWGGHTHFMNAETAYPLDYKLVPATNLELDQWQYHGQRWADPSEKHLRELLRHVQRNPGEAHAKGAKARAHMQMHFSSEAVANQVVARLQLIEEKLTKPSCPPAKTRDAANPQSAIRNLQALNVALEGSFLDLGSLSHVNRELTRQLAKQPKVTLTCVSKNVVPPELAKQKLLVETARRLKYPALKNAHVTIRHAWPPNWERPSSGAWVLIQPWEFGVLPAEWTARLGSVDEIWVYSNYVRRVYVDSGVDPAKVKIVPLGIDPEKFKPGLQPLNLTTAKSFKFLFVGGTIHRKGPDLLLKAYLENFTAADDVCLVIKDFGGQSVYAGQTFESQIRAAQAQPNAPEILYLNEDLEPDALPGLYAACDCLVHPYRGEGFGLPVLEAMACGLPVVVTGGGSTDDFATDEIAYRIPALKTEFGSAVSGLKLLRNGWLLEPDLAALTARMKWVVANRDKARTTGRAASEHVRREWTWERAAQIAAHRMQELIARGGANSGEAPQRSSKPITLPPVAKIGDLGDARELFRQGKLVPAWLKTVAALNVRPFHPEAFLLLGEIAQAAGDSKQAREFAAHARTLAPKWKPAQQFLKSPSSKTQVEVELPALPPSLYSTHGTSRLTVCLITKNEERFLGQCLESVGDLAQQIVVVDTGSTDGTRDIAVRHGAELYSFDWCDDFSAARNAALERAVGDWVLFLDADEELLPGQREVLLKAMQDNGAIAYRLPIINEGREDEGVSYVPRLFRNAPGLFHVGRVHEQVFSSVEVRRAEWGLQNKLGTVQLLHRGYTKEMVKSRDKIARNLQLLQKALEEMPGEANLLMNLGLELVRAGRLHGGLEQYDAAFRALSALPAEEVVPELRETLLTQFCTDLLSVKNYAEIGRVQRSPLAKAGGLTASLHWLFGLACIESKNFVEGAEQMRQCLAKRDKPALSPVNKNILKAGPSHCLALCLSALKQTEAADKAFRAAVETDPKSSGVQFDYARFLAENGREVEALKWVHQLSTADPSDAMIWQLGGHVALSKPDFLEFACDWTSEAVKFFPAHGGIAQQRAQALLLSGQPDGALPLWKQFGAAANPSHRAALIICETLLNQPLQPVPAEMAGRVEQEFVTWYRRLLAVNAGKVIHGLNQRTEPLRRVVPGAVQMLEAARAEANSVVQ